MVNKINQFITLINLKNLKRVPSKNKVTIMLTTEYFIVNKVFENPLKTDM